MASHSTTTSNASGFSAISATHPPGGGPFSFFATNFYSRGRELAAGPADEQLFTRQNFLCPAMDLSYSDITLLALALLSYRSVQKRISTHDKGRQLPMTVNYRQLVSVCNTSRGEASSSLLRGPIKSTKGGSQI